MHRTQSLAERFERAVDVLLQTQQVACCFDMNTLRQIATGNRAHHAIDIANHAVQRLQSRVGLFQALAELATAVAVVNLVVELAMQQSL